MNKERKDELGKEYLLSGEITEQDCSGLDIQELIFLIHYAKHLMQKESVFQNMLANRIPLFYNLVKEKTKQAEKLYFAYEKNTNYPFIDQDEKVWIFSKKEYADEAADYFMQKMMMLDMKEVPHEEISRMLGQLHIWGIPAVIMDNGQYHLEIQRDELLPPPDWSETPEIQIPVTNPSLQHAMITFFQEISFKQDYEGRQRRLQAMEARMLDQVLQARYLVPMQLHEQEPSAAADASGMKTIKEGARIQLAVLTGEEDTAWLPVFTDWIEFEKGYDKKLWSSNIATYEDVAALSNNMTGAVINFRGLSLRLDEANKKRLEEFRKIREEMQKAQQNAGEDEAEAEAAEEASQDPQNESPSEPQNRPDEETRAEDHAPVVIGEPRVYPEKMIEEVSALLKKQKNVRKAYLRMMRKGDEQRYVIILDFEGSREPLFTDVAGAASPHLKGLDLDVVGLNGWKEQVEEVEPFYKKKRFGLW